MSFTLRQCNNFVLALENTNSQLSSDLNYFDLICEVIIGILKYIMCAMCILEIETFISLFGSQKKFKENYTLNLSTIQVNLSIGRSGRIVYYAIYKMHIVQFIHLAFQEK